jgi:hypothetical protein
MCLLLLLLLFDAKIRDGLGGVGGGWFQDCVWRKVGDGADTFFWHDPWLGGVPLGVRFKSLFELVVDKSCTVSLMSAIGGMRGGGVEVEETIVGFRGGYVRGVCHIT